MCALHPAFYRSRSCNGSWWDVFPVLSASLCGEASWLLSLSEDKARTKAQHPRRALRGGSKAGS